MNRRRFLTTAGVTAAGATAGCLAGPEDQDADLLFELDIVGTESDEHVDIAFADPVVTPGDPAVLTVTVENQTGEPLELAGRPVAPFGIVRARPVESGSVVVLWNDAYEDSEAIKTDSGWITAVDNGNQRMAFPVDGSVTARYEIRADPPTLAADSYLARFQTTAVRPDLSDGERLEFVVRFTAEKLRSRADTPELVRESPRVDEPPQDIEQPDPPEDPGDSDEYNDEYLGENIHEEPSLDFETLPSVRLRRRELFSNEGSEYRVRVLGTERERDAVLEADDEVARERLDTVDFDTHTLVVVESGYGSGSVSHRWVRVEDDDGNVHLHGYYTSPYLRTSDLTSRYSVLAVERPAGGDDLIRVSLTTSEDRRVHFNSTEGVVSLEE